MGKNKFLFIDFAECYPQEDLTLAGVTSIPGEYTFDLASQTLVGAKYYYKDYTLKTTMQFTINKLTAATPA